MTYDLGSRTHTGKAVTRAGRHSDSLRSIVNPTSIRITLMGNVGHPIVCLQLQHVRWAHLRKSSVHNVWRPNALQQVRCPSVRTAISYLYGRQHDHSRAYLQTLHVVSTDSATSHMCTIT
jgi:hypothetical protein